MCEPELIKFELNLADNRYRGAGDALIINQKLASLDTSRKMETTATTNTAATPQNHPQGDRPPRKQYPPRFNDDGTERPYRGRGRGGFRNQRDNQDGQVENSDNFYNQRPSADGEFRGRGQYRGRGARGRGTWQSARPAYRGDLNDDEEIITVTPAQNNFINAMQKHAQEQNFGLSVSACPNQLCSG